MSIPKIDLQVQECETIKLRHCEHTSRRWTELDFVMKDGTVILNLAVWHPENDKEPVIEVLPT